MFLRNLALFFTTFVFIYGWKVTSLADLVLLTSLALIFISFVVFRADMPKQVVFILGLLYALSIYALALTVIHGVVETEFVLRTIRSFINFAGGAALAYLYWKYFKDDFIKYLVLHLYSAVLLHGILIVFMAFFEGFRLGVYDLTGAYLIVNLNAPFLNGYRIPGLTYGLASTSVLQMFGLLLLPAALHYWGTNSMRILYLLSGAVIILISMFYTGNTGVLLALFLFPLALLLTFGLSLFRVYSSKFFKLGIVSILLFLVAQSLFILLPEAFHGYTMERATEINEFFANSGETDTTITLKDMYHLPQNAGTFLFGSSEMGRGEAGNTPSDVGWVRGIFAVGAVGTVLMIIPYFYGMKKSLSLFFRERPLAIVTFLILAGGFLLHFKEMGLYTRNAWSIHAVLIAACIIVGNSKIQSMKRK